MTNVTLFDPWTDNRDSWTGKNKWKSFANMKKKPATGHIYVFEPQTQIQRW